MLLSNPNNICAACSRRLVHRFSPNITASPSFFLLLRFQHSSASNNSKNSKFHSRNILRISALLAIKKRPTSSTAAGAAVATATATTTATTPTTPTTTPTTTTTTPTTTSTTTTTTATTTTATTTTTTSTDEEPWVGEWKSKLKQMRREVTLVEGNIQRKETLQSSARVVAFAISSNLIMFSGKMYAALVSGSSSMFSEALHSLADVINESLLMWGIWRSLRQPDPEHPYGYTMEKYAWSLVSGVGIFFLGGGVSIYHGISGLMAPHALGDTTLAWYVLGGSLLFEGATMTYAFRTIAKSARAAGVGIRDYVFRGADPTTVQVLLEDVAAVTGVLIAGSSLYMSQYLNSPFVDSCGSLAIGVLLGSVAAFLVRRNIASLVERRMDIRREREIVKVLEGDGVVRSVHDVKSTMLGGDYVRFKAEILFNGEQVAKRYLHSLPPAILKREMEMLKECSSEKEMRQWIVRHGSGIIGMLGSEVDRIEWEIKKAVPEVKHCDLEIL